VIPTLFRASIKVVRANAAGSCGAAGSSILNVCTRLFHTGQRRSKIRRDLPTNHSPPVRTRWSQRNGGFTSRGDRNHIVANLESRGVGPPFNHSLLARFGRKNRHIYAMSFMTMGVI